MLKKIFWFFDLDDQLKRVMNMYSSYPSNISLIHFTTPSGNSFDTKSAARLFIILKSNCIESLPMKLTGSGVGFILITINKLSLPI